MGIIVGKRSKSVKFFLSCSIPKRKFNVDIVDIDICVQIISIGSCMPLNSISLLTKFIWD